MALGILGLKREYIYFQKSLKRCITKAKFNRLAYLAHDSLRFLISLWLVDKEITLIPNSMVNPKKFGIIFNILCCNSSFIQMICFIVNYTGLYNCPYPLQQFISDTIEYIHFMLTVIDLAQVISF